MVTGLIMTLVGLTVLALCSALFMLGAFILSVLKRKDWWKE